MWALKEKFNSKKSKKGWLYFKDSSNLERNEQNVPDWNKKGYLLIKKNSRWLSPYFKCEPFKYYRLTFKSKSKIEKNLWGVFFYDKQEQMNSSDVYSSVFSSKQWMKNVNIFRGREHCIKARISFAASEENFHIKDLTVEKISPKDVLKWANNFYKELPPISYKPEQEKWKYIPKTIESLKSGKEIRIVMLGDSIINDTNNSHFEVLLKETYPKSNIKMIPSVESSKGCWYYIEGDRLKKYVMDKNPDLLIIGGISQNNDIESIKKVIQQIKLKCNCEILLLSGPMGKDWRTFDREGKPIFQDWNPEPFNETLGLLAIDEKVEFFDIGSLWHKYLACSGKPFLWFHRDNIHANDRGKQILGRFLLKYFS
jgi:hypothetical protein